MKLKIAKIVVRVIGTLSALFGLLMLCVMLWVFQLTKTTPGARTSLVLPFLSSLPFAVWLIYVGYFVWRDFSPLVVRRVCSVLAFLGFISIAFHTIFKPNVAENEPWTSLAFIGLILLTWGVYRIVSKRLNHWLFPEFG